MREKQVEQKLVQAVKARGGICPKFVSPGFDGMPDRIVLLPGRHLDLWRLRLLGRCQGRYRYPGTGLWRNLDFRCMYLMVRRKSEGF